MSQEAVALQRIHIPLESIVMHILLFSKGKNDLDQVVNLREARYFNFIHSIYAVEKSFLFIQKELHYGIHMAH